MDWKEKFDQIVTHLKLLASIPVKSAHCQVWHKFINNTGQWVRESSWGLENVENNYAL